MKKMETSKRILLISYVIGVILAVIVILCTFLQIECSNLAMIAGAAWAEISASNIFYYNMNKKLNLPKVVMHLYDGLEPELKAQVDINNLLNNLMN